MNFEEFAKKNGINVDFHADYHQHENGGGWIKNTAQVEKSVFVGENAWIYGNAKISGKAEIYGNAEIYGYARIYGNAEISGNAKISGNAEISGNAKISGKAEISGNAKISGNARIYDSYILRSDDKYRAEISKITDGIVDEFKSLPTVKLERELIF